MKNPVAPKQADQWSARIPLSIGILAIVLLFGGLGSWSILTKISGAVVSAGMIQVETNRQVIQHPEGGVVGEILAKDGDVVKAGEILIRLSGVRQQSELAIVEGQLLEIRARLARLSAEKDGRDKIHFDPELEALAQLQDSNIRDRLQGERALFHARRESLQQEAEQLAEQIAQIENRIKGVRAQLDALQIQRDLIADELADQQTLLDSGLTQASRVLELQREQAGFLGEIGRLEAEIAELRGQIAANRIALLQLATQSREEAVSTIRDLEFRQIELVERRLALIDTLSRLEVRAPIGGIIFGSTVFALQSVIQPAGPIMYIVPQDEPLIITARIEPNNIDEVSIGQEASLRFSAFDQRQTPVITGFITKLSADTLVDEATGLNYFSAEVLPQKEELEKLGDQVLLPGMPVEVFFKKDDRTPLAYLTKPLTDYFFRAFRE